MASPLTPITDEELLRYATPDELDEAKLAGFFDKTEHLTFDLDKPSGVDGTPEVEELRRGVWLPPDHSHIHRTYYGILDHGPRPGTHFIVLHVNAGSYAGTLSWFRGGSRGVGAHVEIGPGYAAQLVPMERKCWHAVEANTYGIGFEHAGYGRSRAEWLAHGEDEMKLSAAMAAWCLHQFNLGQPSRHHNIMFHSDGGAAWGGHACPGDHFPYDVWSRLCHHYYMTHWGR